MQATIELAEKIAEVFAAPRGSVRYRCLYGGRGSGKSFSMAKMAAVLGARERLRILCTREFQASIKESFYAELVEAVSSEPWLADHYEIGESFIRGKRGTEFIFRGLRHNIQSIKSTAHIDICIIEEAEDVPERSWRDLMPTVRARGSEVWAIWNPRTDGSPVDRRFIKATPPRTAIAKVNSEDNPWLPDVLKELRAYEREVMDDGMYAHVWGGEYLKNTESIILSGKVRVSEFEAVESWDGPYYGVDWGFARDPMAAVRCWIDGQRLMVDYTAGGVGIELDDIPAKLIAGVPGIESHTSRADSARPEVISYVKRNGLPSCISVDKWAGSVEDGITHLRNYSEIVVHPRCRPLIQEARLYSYKTDRLTGDIKPEPVDAHNHYIDALRYALQPIIRKRGGVFVGRA